MTYESAPDIKLRIDELIARCEFTYIRPSRIFCIRSFDAKTRAIARIWGMGKIFPEVAGIPVTYIIEVNRKRFDKQSLRDQTKTLIHELLHIPKNFSGALRNHSGHGVDICDKTVEEICTRYNI